MLARQIRFESGSSWRGVAPRASITASSPDDFNHHRAACAQTGVLGRRGFALDCPRVPRKWRLVRALDFDVPNTARDGRRLEVVADGLEGSNWPLTPHNVAGCKRP